MQINMSNNLSEFFDRSVEAVFPSKEAFLKALSSDKQLRIYIGIDPTAPDLHLGHSTNFLLFKYFQETGHKIILLVGDFTAMIGDPSGKTTERKPLTEKGIQTNLKTYKNQISKVITFEGTNAAEFKFNSEWLDKLSSRQIMRLLSHVTVQQLLERDMFQQRMKAGNPIAAHEFLYPLLQGYDSVALEVDVEVGGNDQTFNMLIGRELLKRYKNKEKFVVATKLLVNPKTGKKLMSKSEGSYISLQDPPTEMFGKAMALPDEVILECLTLCTLLSNEEIETIKKLKPMDAKKELAYEIVRIYHGQDAAQKAQSEFERVFQKKLIPEGASIVEPLVPGQLLIDFLTKHGSKSQAKRLLEQGAIEVDGVVVQDPRTVLNNGQTVRIGKKKFVKVTTK